MGVGIQCRNRRKPSSFMPPQSLGWESEGFGGRVSASEVRYSRTQTRCEDCQTGLSCQSWSAQTQNLGQASACSCQAVLNAVVGQWMTTNCFPGPPCMMSLQSSLQCWEAGSLNLMLLLRKLSLRKDLPLAQNLSADSNPDLFRFKVWRLPPWIHWRGIMLTSCSLVTVLMLALETSPGGCHSLRQLICKQNLTEDSHCSTWKGKHRDKARNMGTLEILWHLSSKEQPERRAERLWETLTLWPSVSPSVSGVSLLPTSPGWR